MTEIQDDERLSEKILKKLIHEKKQKQQLNDEMEEVSKQVRGVVLRMQLHVGLDLDENIEYLANYNECLQSKLLAGLFL